MKVNISKKTRKVTSINWAGTLTAKNEEAVKAAYNEFAEQVRQAAENTDLVVEEDDPPVI